MFYCQQDGYEDGDLLKVTSRSQLDCRSMTFLCRHPADRYLDFIWLYTYAFLHKGRQVDPSKMSKKKLHVKVVHVAAEEVPGHLTELALLFCYLVQNDENLSKGDYIQEQVGGGFLDLPLTSTQLRTSIKATLRDSGVVQKSRSRQTKLVKKVPRNPITATSQNYTPKPFTIHYQQTVLCQTKTQSAKVSRRLTRVAQA
ncbi:hypothetical protein SERLA73DRAFT_149044 [Serpula lacrymans var. lacrymans S7.3]|uniref:Uncharacterized protein n=1 Tax=Serpula lacrymans var. lacrymans (strain S7.3) TaxID=936435 RepID=F8PI27_SERL3|nr:hypothetical protein SERLA73DRAFT_149044 [Serpula lacrymans var. lacrymans S7.3]